MFKQTLRVGRVDMYVLTTRTTFCRVATFFIIYFDPFCYKILMHTVGDWLEYEHKHAICNKEKQLLSYLYFSCHIKAIKKWSLTYRLLLCVHLGEFTDNSNNTRICLENMFCFFILHTLW